MDLPVGTAISVHATLGQSQNKQGEPFVAYVLLECSPSHVEVPRIVVSSVCLFDSLWIKRVMEVANTSSDNSTGVIAVLIVIELRPTSSSS